MAIAIKQIIERIFRIRLFRGVSSSIELPIFKKILTRTPALGRSGAKAKWGDGKGNQVSGNLIHPCDYE